jgi:galactonate dehydratase
MDNCYQITDNVFWVVLTALETIRCQEWPNLLWVQVTDADGRTGIGETFYAPAAVEAILHDVAAPLVLGHDAGDIEGIWQVLSAAVNFYASGGAEFRAISALDIALWDLAAKRAGVSVGRLLGGRMRDRIRTYNTCVDTGPFLDQTGWLSDPARLARDLLEQGISGMKVWPWDRFAPQLSGGITGPAGWSAMGPVGHDLPEPSLREGLDVIAAIRAETDIAMDIMVEGHGRWDLPTAIRICRALEPFDVRWVEDIMQPTNMAALARLVTETRQAQAVSERLFTRWAYREALERGAAHVVMVDVAWTGGITEARKIAALADTYSLPIAPHDCTGPISLAASLQLCAHAPNATVMETVRGFLTGWYREVIDSPFVVADGAIEIADRPGLGVELRAEVWEHPDAVIRRSRG